MLIKCKYFPAKFIKKASDTFCLYSSNDWSSMPVKVAKANRSGYATVKVVGTNLPRVADQTIEFTGEWKYSNKYGYTFYAESYICLMPDTKRGIIKFLASPKFKGIGKKTAEAIVDTFGTDTLRVIETSPEQLIKVKGIDLNKINTIKKVYQENIALNNLTAYLTTFGVKSNIISKIYEKYPKDPVEVIKANPYILLEVRGVGFKTCENITATLNRDSLYSSTDRIVGCLTDSIKSICDATGDMCVDYAILEENCLKTLNLQTRVKIDTACFRNAFKNAAENGKVVCRGKKYVFLKRYDEAEENIAKMIAGFVKQPCNLNESFLSKAISNYKEGSYELSKGQKEAVKMAMMNGISILTGGAGTGKTSVVKAIAAIYQDLYQMPVFMLAPTGKAARRLAQATGHEASTIHSKLHLAEDFNDPYPIDDGLVIVDESSMIDSLLMEKLLSAVSSKSKILFVGDINQLQSVGCGAVLRELISSGKVPVSELTETFRQKDGSTIIENATKINDGNSNLLTADDFVVKYVADEHDAILACINAYKDEILLNGYDKVALITPLRRTLNRYKCVSEHLNKLLQEEVNPLNQDSVSVTLNSTEYRINDRVMQWKNTENSSNGDIGIITSIDSTDEGIMINIAWENGNNTKENSESMENIRLAYSYTIHKSQGSEYDTCIIPLLEEQMNGCMTRNLLYTGITRAKKKCIIITSANSDVLSYCVNNPATNKRITFLCKRLQQLVK